MSGADLDDHVAIAARIGVAAALLGIPADAMIAQLIDVAGGLTNAMVFSDADLVSLGLGVELPSDPYLARRAANLAAGVSGSKWLSALAMARAGDRWVQRGIGPDGPGGLGPRGVTARFAVVGPATLTDDLAVAAAVGVSPAARESLSGRLRGLTEDADGLRERLVRATVFSGPTGKDATIELATQATGALLERIRAVAPAFGIGDAQVRLLEQIHPVLSGGRSVWVGVAATADAILPGVTVSYGPQSADHALRVVSGLASRRDAVARFGSVMGAIGADQVRTLEVSLGPIDPVPMQFGAVVKK